MSFKISISQKLVGLLLAFAFVPLATSAVVSQQAATGVESALAAGVGRTANQTADKIDRLLYERYGDAQAFSRIDSIQQTKSWYKADEKENPIVAAMNGYMTLYDMYYLMILVDKDGRTIAVNSRDSSGKSIDTASLYKKSYADAPWFKAVSANQFTTRSPHAAAGNGTASGTFVEAPEVDEDARRAYGGDGLTIGFAAVVKGPDGKPLGYWCNRAKFSIVEGIAKDVYLEAKASGRPGTSVSVLDDKGRTLLDLDPARRKSEEPPHGSDVLFRAADRADVAVREVMDGKTGFGAVSSAGGPAQIVGYTRDKGSMGFPGLDWAIVVRVPRDEAMVALVAQEHTMWALYGVFFVMVVGLGVLAARRIARPLVGMSEAARAVSKGDLSAKIEYRSSDEIGELATSLRGLLDYLGAVGAGVDAIGRGDLDAVMEKRSEADAVATSMIRARGSLRQLVEGVDRLIDAARSGNLGMRSEAQGLEGAYRRLTLGMNEVMAAVDAPLREMRTVVERVADRDLTARMTAHYEGDYEAVKQGINLALTNVESALDGVSVASDQVATAAGEISTGSQSLSQAASEQASSLEEVTSSLQEITAMSRQNAANAQQARGMAQGAKDCAELGVASMKDLSEAVQAIKSHAAQTAKIVKTIDEIAFQTNLLALNAAVEAARAGDAGKGFAVVAEEVRSLAMRSADAAKTTSRLIEESVKSSDLGVLINAQASAHFNEITDRVKKVVEVMEEIAAASDNQSRGVSQINGAVDEMARVTQHNAATTEQSAAAAEELSSQAAAVQSLVRDFHTTSSDAEPRAVRPAPVVRPRHAPAQPKSGSRLRASARPAPVAAAAQADFFPLDDEESLRAFEQF